MAEVEQWWWSRLEPPANLFYGLAALFVGTVTQISARGNHIGLIVVVDESDGLIHMALSAWTRGGGRTMVVVALRTPDAPLIRPGSSIGGYGHIYIGTWEPHRLDSRS